MVFPVAVVVCCLLPVVGKENSITHITKYSVSVVIQAIILPPEEEQGVLDCLPYHDSPMLLWRCSIYVDTSRSPWPEPLHWSRIVRFSQRTIAAAQTCHFRLRWPGREDTANMLTSQGYYIGSGLRAMA